MLHNKEDSIIQACKVKADLTSGREFDSTMIEKQSLDVLFLSSLFNTCRISSRQTRGNIGIEKMVQ
jgi:hypothetical protein